MKNIAKPVRRLLLLCLLLPLSTAQAKSVEQLCRDTVMKYAHIADLGDPAKFAELFTNDAIFDGGTFSMKGKAEIAAAMNQPDRPRGTSRHIITNHIVTEKDGVITGTSYYQLFATGPDGPTTMENQPVAVGVYQDVYAIEGGICKFRERHATRAFSR
jgi:hypothetical protein